MRALIAEIRETVAELKSAPGEPIAIIRAGLQEAVAKLAEATDWMLETHSAEDVMAVSVDYLMLAGFVCGGWQLARAAHIASQKRKDDPEHVFYEAKAITARFYAEHILPKATGLCASIKHGGASIMALTEEQF
jgi:hypothetical protein